MTDITAAEMVVGVHYIATAPDLYQEFAIGDSIYLHSDGSIISLDRKKWIHAYDVLESTIGMRCQIDETSK